MQTSRLGGLQLRARSYGLIAAWSFCPSSLLPFSSTHQTQSLLSRWVADMYAWTICTLWTPFKFSRTARSGSSRQLSVCSCKCASSQILVVLFIAVAMALRSALQSKYPKVNMPYDIRTLKSSCTYFLSAFEEKNKNRVWLMTQSTERTLNIVCRLMASTLIQAIMATSAFWFCTKIIQTLGKFNYLWKYKQTILLTPPSISALFSTL